MTRTISIIMAALLVLLSADASARTTIHHLDVADIFNNSEYASRLQGVTFYFGGQSHGKVAKSYGEYRTNKKTNAFNKSDKEACEWVMLSALLALHSRALDLGANAVVNIRSNFKNNLFVSDTQYSCGAGGLMAGVALIGDVVKLE
jgi:uncharacterized protein YbjQ (UPF0145 family)